MPFNEKRAASIKDSLLDMLLGDASTRHVSSNPTRSLRLVSTLPCRRPWPLESDWTEFRQPPFFATLFLGTASGQFLRPAASRLLLSRFRP